MAWLETLKEWLDDPIAKVIIIPAIAGGMGWLGSRLSEGFKAKKAVQLEDKKFDLRVEEALVTQRVKAIGEFLGKIESIREYLRYFHGEETTRDEVDSMSAFVNCNLHVLDKKLVLFWAKYKVAIDVIKDAYDPHNPFNTDEEPGIGQWAILLAQHKLRDTMLDELSKVANEVMQLPKDYLYTETELSKAIEDGKALSGSFLITPKKQK